MRSFFPSVEHPFVQVIARPGMKRLITTAYFLATLHGLAVLKWSGCNPDHVVKMRTRNYCERLEP